MRPFLKSVGNKIRFQLYQIRIQEKSYIRAFYQLELLLPAFFYTVLN